MGTPIQRWILFIAVAIMLSGCGGKSPSPANQPASAVSDTVDAQHDPPDFVPVEEEPIVIKKVEPVYPPEDVAAGREGKVWLKMVVDEKGSVTKVIILKNDASDAMGRAAVQAARGFQFKPAKLKGNVVAVWVSVPFKFKLAEKKDTSVAG